MKKQKQIKRLLSAIYKDNGVSLFEKYSADTARGILVPTIQVLYENIIGKKFDYIATSKIEFLNNYI